MLAVFNEPRDGAWPVKLKCKQADLIQYALESEELCFDQCLHVTDLEPDNNESAIFLDGCTRVAFASIVYKPNTVHMLAAGAGSGKSQCVINLGASQEDLSIVFTFNKKAQMDGERRSKAHKQLHWRTIDSVVWELYKAEFKEVATVDLSDANSVCAMAQKVVGRVFSVKEVKTFLEALRNACEIGDASKLQGVAKVLFDAGMNGKWWSYSLLRIRALTNPAWSASMAKYSTIIVDEAQDINRVMLSLIKQLHAAHMVVYVRDLSQKIYSFIQCVDIADHMEQEYTAWNLHVTFRFGQALCDYIEENQLSHTKTVPSPDCPNTQIDYIDDCDIVPGAHTVLMSAWEQILRTAERYMRAGRHVCIDEEKKQDLLKAVQCTGWSKYEWLFSRLPKARVAQILNDLVDETDEAEDLVLLSTVHMAKGLQYRVVRVSRCVLESNHRDPDHRRKHYVAVTRAMEHLYLPAAAISTAQKRKISL